MFFFSYGIRAFMRPETSERRHKTRRALYFYMCFIKLRWPVTHKQRVSRTKRCFGRIVHRMKYRRTLYEEYWSNCHRTKYPRTIHTIARCCGRSCNTPFDLTSRADTCCRYIYQSKQSLKIIYRSVYFQQLIHFKV